MKASGVLKFDVLYLRATKQRLIALLRKFDSRSCSIKRAVT